MNYTTTTPLVVPALSLPLSSYPFYALHRPSILPSFPDRYLSVVAPFAIYWLFSLFFHLLDSLHWPSLERYKLHEPDEVVSKNRVTVKEVIKAVLLQQALQTVLGLLWLEEDDPLKGPFRNHRADLERYGKVLGRVVIAVLGDKVGGNLWRNQGAEWTSWVYWWGVPIGQYLFAA
jgi:sphinganine C4-monooxygenase